jgi:hypothetical protein
VGGDGQADDRAARGELGDLAGGVAEEQRRHVAGVDVDEVSVPVELRVKEGYEAADTAPCLHYTRKFLDHLNNFQVLLSSHAQAHDGVPGLEGGGKAVAGGIADGDSQGTGEHLLEVEDVAPHDHRRPGAESHVVAVEPGRLPGEQRGLDLPRLLDELDELALAQSQVGDRAQGDEGVDQLLVRHRLLKRERKEMVAGRADDDGREDVRLDRPLDGTVEAGVRVPHEDPPLAQEVLEDRVAHRHAVPQGNGPALSELLEQLEDVPHAAIGPAAGDQRSRCARRLDQGLQEVMGHGLAVAELLQGVRDLAEPAVEVVHGQGPRIDRVAVRSRRRDGLRGLGRQNRYHGRCLSLGRFFAAGKILKMSCGERVSNGVSGCGGADEAYQIGNGRRGIAIEFSLKRSLSRNADAGARSIRNPRDQKRSGCPAC